MKKSDVCPDVEQISAYFDKECKTPELIGEHLKRCPKCQAYFETLSRIDYSMKHVIYNNSGSDREISGLILKRVHKNIGKYQKFSFFRLSAPVVLRAASLLIFAGTLGYFIWKDYQISSSELLKSGRVHSSAEVPAVLTAYQSGTPVQVNDVQSVMFSSTQDSGKVITPAALIPSRIRHVWQINAAQLNDLQKIIQQLDIKPEQFEIKENICNLKFKGSKLVTVLFVRACYNAGFQLFSPDPPQPETSVFSDDADDIVSYNASLTVK